MKKLVTGIVALSLLVALIVWLWTLQPQPQQVLSDKSNPQSTSSANPEVKSGIDPADNSLLKSSSIKIRGRAGAYQYLAIYSNNSSQVIKVKPQSNFETDFTLTKGLNLIRLEGISQDFKKVEGKTLTYYFDPVLKTSTKVFAGSVKTLFDTLISVSTENGEMNVRTSQNTKFDFPKDDSNAEASKDSAIKDVRIGDFVIALGTPPEKDDNKDSIIADTLQIIRADKPQITKTLFISKVVTGPKQNSFTAKSLENDKIISYSLTKNSDISLDGKDAKSSDIVKDKNAVIFATEQDKDTVVDLIYLIP